MNDDQLLDRLRADTARVTAEHHLAPATAARVLDAVSSQRPAGRRRRMVAVVAAAGAVIAVVAVTAVVSLLSPSRDRTNGPAAGSCGQVATGPLPVWARAGFTKRADHVPHVLGEHGRVVAILFTPRLYSPARTNPHNKILWAVRGGWIGPFVIRAHLMGSATTVRRVLPTGPGPSYVNLPDPGCWQLSLRWGGVPDRLELRYVDGSLPH